MTHPQIGRAIRLMNMEKNGTPTVAQFEALLTDQGRVDAFIELVTRPGALQQITNYGNLMAALSGANADILRLILSNADVFASVFANPSAKSAVIARTSLPKASVPLMTSNTSPAGVVSASTYYGAGYYPWHVFDGDDTTYWQGVGAQVSTEWIEYKFQAPACILGLAISQLMAGYRLQSVSIQHSADGVGFSTAANATLLDIDRQSIEVNSPGFYKHWRLKINSDYGGGAVVVHHLAFSGFME